MQAWVIGNWKQNPATSRDVDTLVTDLLQGIDLDSTSCQLMIAPSCVHVAQVSKLLKDTPILCAAQDISAHSATIGAYTGDCSVQQMADAGATWTILGHSERRQYHRESNGSLIQKMRHALTYEVGIIFCIGETQAEYDAKQTLTIIDEQLAAIEALLEPQSTKSIVEKSLATRLIIAYEPVWAIGTGKVPTVSEVSATHQYIKRKMADFSTAFSKISVIYGGSVNDSNAKSFAADSMIDGALVGGASLKAQSFLAIAKAFSNIDS